MSSATLLRMQLSSAPPDLGSPTGVTTRDARPRLDRRLAGLLAFIVALATYLGVLFSTQPETAGDEPHYLLYAHSILQDGDIEMRDEYEEGDIGAYYSSPSILPHALDYGSGRLISFHNIGVPLLISPVLGITHSVLAVRVLFVLLSALLAHQLFRLLADLDVGPRWLLIVVWAGAMFSLPLLIGSSRIYPEVPGALLVVVAVRGLVRGSRTGDVVAGLAAALAPWFHVRYLVLSLGVGVFLVWRLLPRPTPADPRRRTGSFAAIAMIVASLATMSLLFNDWYGSPWPQAAYAEEVLGDPGDVCDGFCEDWPPLPAPFVGSSPDILYRGSVGWLLTPSYGVLPVAPIFILALPGLVVFARRFGPPAAWGILMAGAYYGAVVLIRPIGTEYPARFLIVLLPLAALVLLLSLRSLPRVETGVFLALLGVTLANVVMGLGVLPSDMTGSGRSEIPLLRATEPIWPTIPLLSQPDGFSLAPSELGYEVGRLEGTGGPVLVASPDRDPPGHLAMGNLEPLVAGRYRARVALRAIGSARSDADAIALIVRKITGEVVAEKVLRGDDLPLGRDGQIDIAFSTDGTRHVDVLLFYAAVAPVEVRSLDVRPIALEPGPAGRDPGRTRYPEVPRAAVWLASLVSLAILADRRRSAHVPPSW